jgi:hypothetical protein
MVTTESPSFPLFLHIQPEPRWQRSLIPLGSLDAMENSGDPPGWVAVGGYRILSRDRRVFSAEYDGSRYHFRATGERLTDIELRELMCRNLGYLRKPTSDYLGRAATLSDVELFDFTFAQAGRLPDMSPALRIAGCAFIIALCLLALVIPIGIVWWLFP